GMGAATPVIFVNFSMVRIPLGRSRALQERDAREKALGHDLRRLMPRIFPADAGCRKPSDREADTGPDWRTGKRVALPYARPLSFTKRIIIFRRRHAGVPPAAPGRVPDTGRDRSNRG